MKTTIPLALTALGFVLSCRSEVFLGEGSEQSALGTAGNPPRADGSCDPGLSVCNGLCEPSCGQPSSPDAGVDSGGDATTPPPPGPDASSPPPPEGTVATGFASISALVTDGTSVYVADMGTSDGTAATGAVSKVAIAGGTPTVLAASLFAPRALALDASSLYWVEMGAADQSNGSISRVPMAGGAPTLLLSNIGYPLGIALNTEASVPRVAWVDSQLLAPINNGLWSANLDGTSPQRLVSGTFFFPLVAAAAGVYLMNGGGSGLNEYPGPFVHVYDAPNPGPMAGIAVAGTDVYFLARNGALVTGPVDYTKNADLPSKGTTLVAGDPSAPPGGGAALAADDANVYYTTCTAAASCTLFKFSRAGGSATAMKAFTGPSTALTLSTNSVLFANLTDVYRIPK